MTKVIGKNATNSGKTGHILENRKCLLTKEDRIVNQVLRREKNG